jgi:hypothetical protein
MMMRMTDGPGLRVRELRVGGASKDELLRRLAQPSVSLNAYARALFAHGDFTTSPEARTVRVAFVSLPEIGLADGGRFEEILDRASQAGLEPCPLEVAPHLRLDYVDQPEGPYLTVASRKLRPGPSTPNGFYLRRCGDGLWLRGYRADADYVYGPEFRNFAFLVADG